MAKTKTNKAPMPPRFEVSLVGRNGNAFMVLGLFQQAAKKAGWTPEQIQAFHDEATQGEYDDLLNTVMKYADVM